MRASAATAAAAASGARTRDKTAHDSRTAKLRPAPVYVCVCAATTFLLFALLLTHSLTLSLSSLHRHVCCHRKFSEFHCHSPDTFTSGHISTHVYGQALGRTACVCMPDTLSAREDGRRDGANYPFLGCHRLCTCSRSVFPAPFIVDRGVRSL